MDNARWSNAIPQKNMGYDRRFGEPPSDRCDNFEFCLCKKCTQCDCGLCRVQSIAELLEIQEEESKRRLNRVSELTATMRKQDEEIDLEWMREQDPVWAQLEDNNREMEEDIWLYIKKIKKIVKGVEKKMGWR